MAIWGDGQKLCRLLIEVVATPATICDKTLTIRQNRVAKLLCLQHPIPSQSLESDGVDEIIEDAGKYLKMHKETIEKIMATIYFLTPMVETYNLAASLGS